MHAVNQGRLWRERSSVSSPSLALPERSSILTPRGSFSVICGNRQKCPVFLVHGSAFGSRRHCRPCPGRNPGVFRPLSDSTWAPKEPPTRKQDFGFSQSPGLVLERVMGVEPTTTALATRCSTAELHPPRCSILLSSRLGRQRNRGANYRRTGGRRQGRKSCF